MSDGSFIGPVQCQHPHSQTNGDNEHITLIKLEGPARDNVPVKLEVLSRLSSAGWAGTFPVMDGVRYFGFSVDGKMGDNQQVGEREISISAKANDFTSGHLQVDYTLEDGSTARYKGRIDLPQLQASALQNIKRAYFDQPSLVCYKIDNRKLVHCGLPALNSGPGRNFVTPMKVDYQVASVEFGCSKDLMTLKDDFSDLGGRYLLFAAPYECNKIAERYPIKDVTQSALATTLLLPLPSLFFGKMQIP
jgi:hypothetical protein